jgi:hypothetical protein
MSNKDVETFNLEWAEAEADGKVDATGGSEWRHAIAARICKHLGVTEPQWEDLDWVENFLWYVQMEGR